MLAVASRLGDSLGFSGTGTVAIAKTAVLRQDLVCHLKMLAFKQISNPAKVRSGAFKKAGCAY